jgi:sensor domain CHASE-containing protein
MIAMLLVFSKTIVKKGFDNVESRDAHQNVGRVRDAFEMQIDNVGVKIVDWSVWDDAYKYMKDGNKAFEDSSLAIGALLGMQFDVFAWRKNDGAFNGAVSLIWPSRKIFP